MEPFQMDERIDRSLGQVGRGLDRPTLLTSDLGRVDVQRAPSMWDRAVRLFRGGRKLGSRNQSRGTRR